MKKCVLAALLLALAAVANGAGDRSDTLAERYSYALGVQLGTALQQRGVGRVDAGAIAAAIDDVLAHRSLRLTDEEMRAAVDDYNAARAQRNAEEGRRYLADNGQRRGVIVLPNGLQYEILRPGAGERPAAGATVRVHYHGTRVDGLVFDSSVSRGQPAEFPLDGVIPGFREAITRMRVGGQWRVVVPGDLAYGVRGAGSQIGPNETLIFDISLLEIVR